MELFLDIHKGTLGVGRLNYGVMTLFPKGADANRTQQFCPCLLNCIYKLISKNFMFRIERFLIQSSIQHKMHFIKKQKYQE